MPDLITYMRNRPATSVLGVVVAVSAEGLDVRYRAGLVTGIARLTSYTSPQIGDVVLVNLELGNPLVIGSIPPPTLGPNLLPNPGFELGTAGQLPTSWKAWTSPVLLLDDNATAHSSQACARFYLTSTSTGAERTLGTVDPVVVDAGQTYRAGAWWSSDVSDPNVSCRVIVVTSDDPAATDLDTPGTITTVATAPASSGWVEVQGSFVVPAGHNFVRMYLSAVVLGTRATSSVYADDASLRLS